LATTRNTLLNPKAVGFFLLSLGASCKDERNQKLSDPPYDCNIIPTFKAQKGSKDIVKIVHDVTVVQP